MAKIIDKVVQQKTTPKDKNVLWDDGNNLKINRNGMWENTSKESSSNQELYAYPVDTLDGKENKVVGLGGNESYIYVGELVASENGPTEEEYIGEVVYTSYLYQPIYDGKHLDVFESWVDEKYITLYVGDDVNGYSSNKVYISEDANNLTYYSFNFVGGFGPRNLEVAISSNWGLYCRNYLHWANKNSKVFFATYKQQLDINLIPQEIVRKEDLSYIESRLAALEAKVQ